MVENRQSSMGVSKLNDIFPLSLRKKEIEVKGKNKLRPPEAWTSVKNAVGLTMIIGFQMDEKQ